MRVRDILTDRILNPFNMISGAFPLACMLSLHVKNGSASIPDLCCKEISKIK